MKFLKTGLVAVLILAIGSMFMMESCKKENLGTNLFNNERVLTDSQIDFIGQKHNEFLTKAFSNFDYNNRDRVGELKIQFNNIAKSNGMDIDWTRKYGDYKSDMKILKSRLEASSFKFIENAELLSKSVITYSDLKLDISKLKERAKNEITNGEDLDVVLTVLTVLDYSSYFWLPEDKGGSGVGSNIYDKLHHNVASKGLRDALIADAAGAGTSLLVGAFVTAFSGGAGVGMLVGAAVEAGIASGFAGAF